MRSVQNFKNWQIQAFHTGRAARFFINQSPGGSGKSLLQAMLAQADIEDTGNKQVLLVPTNHIHHGFFDEDRIEFVLPGAEQRSRWVVGNNFCADDPAEGKTRLLRDFLLADTGSLRKEGQLAAIATHKALVTAWGMMGTDERLKAMRNVSFRIDEAHHISNVFHEVDLEHASSDEKSAILEESTRLGQFVSDVMQSSDESVKLHLASATFFRGDSRTILSERFKADFVQYSLPWDEHYRTLGIDKLTFDFLNYVSDPIRDVLDLVGAELTERHLVIIPALTRRYRKDDSLSRILKGLRGLFPADEVLDLVTPSTQQAHKLFLHRHPEQFRAVVACRLFDEGTDWVPCTRMHNTDACERSVTLAVQRFFRPLRSHPQKKSVAIYNYLPDFAPRMTPEEKRQVLSNRLNAMLACVVTQGELLPCMVRVGCGTPTGNRPQKRSLQELYGDEYPALTLDLLKGYESVEEKTDPKSIEQVVERIIDLHGVPEDVEVDDLKASLLSQMARIARPTGKVLNRRDLESESIDAESIRLQGFDKVWRKVSPVPSLVCYGTENIDLAVVRQLLDIVHKIPSLGEIHGAIKAYYARTGLRPTFHQSESIDELSRSASAVDKLCRRHYCSTLAKEVRAVLGDTNDDLLTRTEALIKQYWDKGIRIGNKYGDLPEIGMTSYALNGRLSYNHKTTLAKEVERILGPQTRQFTLEAVRGIVRKYLQNGIRLHRKFGDIPELRMSSYNLADRLKRNHQVTLSELVKSEAALDA